MNNLRAFVKNKNLLIRIILSYVLVGLLVIAGLTFGITAKVSSDLTKEMNESADRAVKQSYNTANLLLSSVYDHYASAFASADVQSGFYDQEFDTAALGRVGNKLYDLSTESPLVHSVYLFNEQRGLAFSSLTTVRAFGGFFDAGALELLDHANPSREGIFYPRRVDFDIYGKEYRANLISILYLNTGGKATTGAMMLNLDQAKLQSMVMNGAGDGPFQTMILNRQGTVVSHSDESMINRNLSGQDYVRRVADSSELRGTFEMSVGGHDYRISYMKADSLGWTFIGVVDYDALLGKVAAIKRYILAVTAVILALVLLVASFFTRWIYGPIHRLIGSLRWPDSGGKERHAVSEWDLLGRTISYLEHKVQDLQRHVSDYRSAKRQEVLRQLVGGGAADEAETARKLQRAGIAFRHEGFIACVLRLDDYGRLTDAYKPADLALLKYAVSNIAAETCGARFDAVCFDIGEDRLAMVLNHAGPGEEAQTCLAPLLRELQANVRRCLKLSVTAAWGPSVRPMAELKASYDAAGEGARYRLAFGHGSLIPPDAAATREPLSLDRAAQLEKQITDRLKLGDAGKLREAVGELIEEVRKAPYDDAMLFLTQLLIATARTAKAMAGPAEGEEARLDIGELGERLRRLETLGEIQTWYLELCESALLARERQAQSKNRWIVDKVVAHIREHYADPNLTADALAEVGGLSANYMRKVFKEQTGRTIAAYLAELRFERAKELLLTTDLPAGKIGERVGFGNANYFYVSFKKHCGQSPDHYRKQSKFNPVEA